MVMRFRVKFGLMIAAIVMAIFITLMAVLLSSPLLKPARIDAVSFVFSIIWFFAMVFIAMIVLALAISMVTWGRWLGDFNEHASTDDILDKRYSKGEISYGEYLMLKNNIEIARKK